MTMRMTVFLIHNVVMELIMMTTILWILVKILNVRMMRTMMRGVGGGAMEIGGLMKTTLLVTTMGILMMETIVMTREMMMKGSWVIVKMALIMMEMDT